VTFRSAPLTAADAAIFETFVVPRYLAPFGELVVAALVPAESAQVAHVHCRTGHPDAEIARRLGGARVFGCDRSPFAVELARAKASLVPELAGDYLLAHGERAPLPAADFTHAVSVAPPLDAAGRAALFAEIHRLLAPGGQLVVALPLRDSFSEVADLVREHAVKQDDTALDERVARAMDERPTAEGLGAEVERAGFAGVRVDVTDRPLSFAGARAFFDDPAARLVIIPEIAADAAPAPLPIDYLRDAIDTYWGGGPFDLTLRIGCVSATRG